MFLILSCSAVYSLYKQPFWLPEVKNRQSMPVEVILQKVSINFSRESCEVRLLLKFVSANMEKRFSILLKSIIMLKALYAFPCPPHFYN